MPLEVQVAASAQVQYPEPAQTTAGAGRLAKVKSELGAVRGRLSQLASTRQQLDTQAKLLRQQLNRIKELLSEPGSAASGRQEYEDLTGASNQIVSEPQTVIEQQNSSAEELASARERIVELESLLEQAHDESLQNDYLHTESAQSAGAASNKAQSELNTTCNVLAEALATQIELAREVKAIKIHITDTNRSQGNMLSATQQRSNVAGLPAQSSRQLQQVSGERDMLAEELAIVKARIKESDGTTASPDSRPELPGAGSDHEGPADERVQELLELLEAYNAERDALEVDLAQANETIRKLRESDLPWEDKIADYHKQIIELRGQIEEQTSKLRRQLADRTAKLSIAHHRLQQENVQHREAEQMLKRISSRFQLDYRPNKVPSKTITTRKKS